MLKMLLRLIQRTCVQLLLAPVLVTGGRQEGHPANIVPVHQKSHYTRLHVRAFATIEFTHDVEKPHFPVPYTVMLSRLETTVRKT